ncbi:MAG: iron-containing alcohol dehydrogenase [Deltaproteobacteria bacterium]|nr:iron-containing alcohol dehydrogenase [Deltaproteobacteria bacterium]
MATAFEFATAQRIVFGRGSLDQLGEAAGAFGRKALLVAAAHLQRTGALTRVEYLLSKKAVAVERLLVHGEPEAHVVDEAAARARALGSELVIAVGGGSALDVGKAAAGLATNGGSVREYLEGVGTGRALKARPLPFLAAPTTAGTGSEVTRNAVVSSKAEGFKKSIRSPLLLPLVALVDPALTDSTSPAQTAASGLDALTQLIEPFVSTRAMPATDALALEGIRRARTALPRAFLKGDDHEARDDLALASLFGGLCLANAGLGAVHGIAAALGVRFGLPHGLACACVLAATVEVNIRALERHDPGGPALERYAKVGEALAGRAFGSHAEARGAAVQLVRELCEQLKVPRLSSLGVGPARLPMLVAEARGSSMKTNPVVLEDSEIAEILSMSL